jgi:hypothetical protein
MTDKEVMIPYLMTDKQVMIEYLLLKIRQEDWHGVADAAMDIREMEAKCFWTSTTNTQKK